MELEKQLKEYFGRHLWNTNDELIEKLIIDIENDFMKTYWYKDTWEFDFNKLIDATYSEVWEMTSFGVLDELESDKKKVLTDLLYAKKNVKRLLENPNWLIDMRGLEYWAWVVERKRKDLNNVF